MVNMLTDASFERSTSWTSTDDWEFNPSSGNGAFSLQYSSPYHGSRNPRLTALGVANFNLQSENHQYSSCAPGEQVIASVYSRVSNPAAFAAGQGARLDIQFFDNTDSPIAGSAVLSSTQRNANWARVTIQGTAPAGTVAAEVRLMSIQTPIGEWVEFDAAQLEKGTVATAFAVNPAESNSVNLRKDDYWYWANLSSLTPKNRYSLADHKMNYLKSATLGVGTLGDMEAEFLRSRSGLSPVNKFSVMDHKTAYYKSLGVS